MEWEQEQLRRGGHETPDSKASSASKAKQTYKPAPSKNSFFVDVCLFLDLEYPSTF
jgi:hypothetical protein